MDESAPTCAVMPSPVAGLGQAARLPQLMATGNWLTTTTGEVVVLRGVNLVTKIAKTPEELGFNERHARLLAERGFSVVRLGVLWCNVEPYFKPDGVHREYDLDVLASLKRTIALLSRHGIYTLVGDNYLGRRPR